jgi:radical SAM superfamily enzyme YgiQ (UPF0313 family)
VRILLIQPRTKKSLGFSGFSCFEPLGLECIAAPLQAEHDLKQIELYKFDDLDRELRSFEPHICAISCSFTMDVNAVLRIAQVIRNSRSKPFVVVGGHHASLSPNDFLSDCVDAVVIGEGEITFSELISCLDRNGEPRSVPGLALNQNGEQLFTGPRSPVKDLDQLPLPARHLTKPLRNQYFMGFEYPVALVETARGCPFRCNFCSVHKFFQGKVRFKSPERVVEELATIDGEWVLFSDDDFFIDIPRVKRIIELIKERGIKKRYLVQTRSDSITRCPEIIPLFKEVGFEGSLVGLEKVEDEGLESLNKESTIEDNEKALEIIYSNGMGVWASFIVDTSETKEGFAQLLRYIERLGIKSPGFTVLTPLPGTDLFAQVKEKIVIKNRELFDGLHAVLPTKLPLSEFYGELSKLYAAVFESSVLGHRGISRAVSRLRSGRFSLSHLKKLSRTGKMLTDPKCYLVGHTKVT